MRTNKKDPEAVSLLTREQYRVTQQYGMERPFQNDQRRRRSGACVGIRPDGADVALDLDRSPRP